MAENVDQSIFRAYDIRGIYPGQINEEVAKRIAKAYAAVVKPEGEVAVGYDVRVHSKDMAAAVRQALVESGVKVVDIGLVSTDMMYFAVGNYSLAGGIQVTASHNPAEWHGMKMVGAGVKPFTGDKEIAAIKQATMNDQQVTQSGGRERGMNVSDDYADFMLRQLGEGQMKPLKILANPNFGFAGKMFQKIVQRGSLPIEIVPLNMEPDGTFPKGPPDPLKKFNQEDAQKAVVESGADMGIVWDADADRVFFYTKDGQFIEPYYINTWFIQDILSKYPGASVVYDVRYTWGLVDAINENRGKPVIVRVGHSYIKEKMREVDAAFAAESSGHTYYRDFWSCDCGMLPVMQLLKIMRDKQVNLETMVGPVMSKYPISGEINRKVTNPEEIFTEVKRKYADGEQNELDGLSVEYTDYRFNVRKANTEPVFRLNLEAKTKELVKEKTEEVLGIIGGTQA